MSDFDYFSGFRKKSQQTDGIEVKVHTVKRGARKGVRRSSTLKWENNYRKRMKNDKSLRLHHKLLKYSKDLDRSLKDMLDKQWVKDLGIKDLNTMFVYSVREGFIYERFNKENGEDE